MNNGHLRSESSVTDGIVYSPQFDSIAQTWSVPPGTRLSVNNASVAAAFVDRVWLTDQGFGPAISVSGPALVSPGDIVNVEGTLSIDACMRTLTDATVTLAGSGNPPKALSLRSSALGGAPPDGVTPGITGAAGAYNVGRLVRISGRMSGVSGTVFHVDDGSGLVSFAGMPGVAVSLEPGSMPPPPNSFVTVTGILECRKEGEIIKPLIRPRLPSDTVLE